MAQTRWRQSMANFFKEEVVDPAPSPESYLEFSRQCLKEVRTMTSPRDSESSKVVNYEQCVYLVDKLDKALEGASLFHNDHHHRNSMLFEDGKERTLECFKILCMLAKKVKCFIQGCCNGHWLQAAVKFTNLSDCTASLGFDLKMCTVLLPSSNESLRNSITIRDISAWRSDEGELVKEMASKDEDGLVTKLRALIRDGQDSNDDLELATFLLERLDTFKRSLPSISPGSEQPTLQERDLTNLKHMVQIGRGGYGTVHKASWLGIDVAVKTFSGTDNPDFKKEVPILAGLSHPNIVSFLCHGKDMGECFIVMELMDGDLFSLMKERLRNDRTRMSPFSVFEEFDVMLQIAEAMDYLQKMRVLHRDLKSHNILVRCLKSTNAEGYESVQVKVSDFGLSRTKEFSLTQSHMTPNTGTARWMAPELMKFRNPNDIHDIETAEDEKLVENFPFKCDVYSFGMVCLEILTGDVPFPKMKPNAVKRAVCAGERPQLPDRCHEKLKALIEKCWNPVASSRPCFGCICTELRYLKSLHMVHKSQGTWIWTFNISDLRSVTGNFAEGNILGRGDHSVVYKGILAGNKVAVKRMMGAVTRLGFEFIKSKVRGWLSVRRPYLVEMLGYCIDGDDLLLVNEYMSQGTLAELLFKLRSVSPANSLSWTRRWKIAMDIAQALYYMHKCGSIFLHFDLKSSNVLFDDDFNAKVSGFGLANRFELASLPQGAGPSRYMSPEFTCGGMGERADHVYSFGVVLMELLTGRPAMNKKQDLVTLFRKRHGANLRSPTLFDPRRDLASNFDSVKSRKVKSMLAVGKLAMACTEDNPDARPEMDLTVGFLRRPPSRPVGKTPAKWGDWLSHGTNLRGECQRQPHESVVQGIRENLLPQEAYEEADEEADRAVDREAFRMLSLLPLLALVLRIFCVGGM